MTSDAKFTPGPWTIYTDLPEDHGDYIDHGGYRIDANGVEQLAYVWERSARVNPGTGLQDDSLRFGAVDAQANARLIASAPDLYEALKAFVDDCSNDECEFCIRARAALSKAEGAP